MQYRKDKNQERSSGKMTKKTWAVTIRN